MGMVVGYSTGVFDLFHVGHLNLLKEARNRCDHLIVGITDDELAMKIKGRMPVIPLNERIKIVSELRCVDAVVRQRRIDELQDYKELKFNKIFKGSDWKGTKKWNELTQEFAIVGVEVCFLPYTEHTSSTQLREVLDKILVV